MKILSSATWLLVPATFFMTIGSVAGQEALAESQVVSDSIVTTISAEPFSVFVILESNGSLSVNPDWAMMSGKLPFADMQLPPQIRTTTANGWLLGEFALRDGTWSPLFSVPNIAETVLGSNTIDSRGDQAIVPKDKPNLTKTNTSIGSRVIETIYDPLAKGSADLDFPKNVTAEYLQSVINRPLAPGTRRFFVNNSSGDDASEGKMLHPQSGKLMTKGPKLTVAAVLQQIQSGDEIVIIGTGKSYTGNFVIPNITDIIITPVGDVTLNP